MVCTSTLRVHAILGTRRHLSGDNRVVRNSYHLQILSRSPGSPRGEDHSAVANHICGLCHIICLQEGAGVANHPTLHHRFHVVTGCHCAVLLNKDTCECDVTTKPIMALAKYHAGWALQEIRRRDGTNSNKYLHCLRKYFQ